MKKSEPISKIMTKIIRLVTAEIVSTKLYFKQRKQTMKKHILTILILLLSYNLAAQINYEKGYFIDNNGNRTECLIKNMDLHENPTKFKYKLSESEKPITKTINEVKEFGVDNMSKYRRFTVKVDKSSGNVHILSNKRKPIFKEDDLFLKVIVEGKANLYLYNSENIKKSFFYDTDDVNIQQLIYKEYLLSDNYSIRENNRYKQQLLNNLKCKNIKNEAIKELNYTKTDLANYFLKYNKCDNSDFTHHVKKQKRRG